MMRRDLCKEFNYVCVLQNIMVCLFSLLSGVWVVEMAGGFETEAGGSHQTRRSKRLHGH